MRYWPGEKSLEDLNSFELLLFAETQKKMLDSGVSVHVIALTKFSAEGPQGQRARLLQMDQTIHAE